MQFDCSVSWFIPCTSYPFVQIRGYCLYGSAIYAAHLFPLLPTAPLFALFYPMYLFRTFYRAIQYIRSYCFFVWLFSHHTTQWCMHSFDLHTRNTTIRNPTLNAGCLLFLHGLFMVIPYYRSLSDSPYTDFAHLLCFPYLAPIASLYFQRHNRLFYTRLCQFRFISSTRHVVCIPYAPQFIVGLPILYNLIFCILYS